jgi:hypothetical protein
MTTLAALNDKFGLVTDAVLIAAIWVGIGSYAVAPELATALVTAAGLAGGVVGAAQVLVIMNEGVSA